MQPSENGPASDPCMLQSSYDFLGQVLSGGATTWAVANVSIGETAASTAAQLTAPILTHQAVQHVPFPSIGRGKTIGNFTLNADVFLGLVKAPAGAPVPARVGFQLANPTSARMCIHAISGIVSAPTGYLVPQGGLAPIREMADIAIADSVHIGVYLEGGQQKNVTAVFAAMRNAASFHSIADLVLHRRGGGFPGSAAFRGQVNVSVGTDSCSEGQRYSISLNITNTNLTLQADSGSG